MKKIAICIPTYNRSDVVDELLRGYCDLYNRLNFDIYIYDSSESNETMDVVNRYCEMFDNILYIHLDSKIHSNMKVYKIFQSFSEKREYKYIWVCSDSIRWTELVLKKVNLCLAKTYDMLVVDYRDVDNLGDRVYNKPNDVFVDLAWYMTLYGAVILNLESMLLNLDWEYYIGKYCRLDIINFSHVWLYFDKLSKMNSINVLHLSFDKLQLTSSPLKKYSGWYNETFEICCCSWPRGVRELPSYYEKYKDDVIMRFATKSGVLSRMSFLELRKNNVLTVGKFIEYLNMWRKVTDVSILYIFIISLLPIGFAYKILYRERVWFKMRKEIKNFYKKYPLLYVYGCGGVGNSLAEYLEMYNIEYQGFLVSNANREKKTFRDHPVSEYTGSIFDDPRVGIIIAVNKQNYESIINKFDESLRKRTLSEFDIKE